MRDARRMNRAMMGYLKQPLQGAGHDSPMCALALMMTGLMRSKSSNFEQIGSKSGAPAKLPSREKQIQRFAKNQQVAYETHFMPFIHIVIASLELIEFRLSIASSQVGRERQ